MKPTHSFTEVYSEFQLFDYSRQSEPSDLDHDSRLLRNVCKINVPVAINMQQS